MFASPLRTPFRDVVSAVNTSLLSGEVRAMQRLSSLQLYLIDALEDENPRHVVLERLGGFVDATVTLFAVRGQGRSTRPDRRPSRRSGARSRPAQPR